ncbi:MipA/OmpV family protein [Vreelandella sedimenti]|uniref:MipA/OmpV family protein n=1 Tax=Vreelandella sedimenti TaxID=2729618 RepID=UPI00257CCA7C|nr:MipA/OmpV family protein [Halomonas sp. UBA3173]|tara:strand:+ start:38004 stop:38819 length:816 start_codon:yes stop_codon:yes gene_type:complete
MGSHQSLLLKGHLTSMRLATTAFISGLVIASPVAFADEANSDETTWGLGVGAVSSQEPYTDVDRDNTALPLLYVENRYVRFFGTTLEAKLPDLTLSESNQINFSLIGRWDGSGYEPGDSWVLEGMEERESGLWAGAKVEWQTSIANVSADWTHDVASNSKGQRLNLGLDRSWQMGAHLTLTPRIGATWHDDNYVDYYYGVRSNEARPGRPEYQGESSVSAEIGLQSVYRFNNHHSIMFDVQATTLASETKDSPLVDDSTINRVLLGYMYHF